MNKRTLVLMILGLAAGAFSAISATNSAWAAGENSAAVEKDCAKKADGSEKDVNQAAKDPCVGKSGTDLDSCRKDNPGSGQTTK